MNIGGGIEMISIIIVGIILLLLIIWTISTYNKFVTLRERVDNGKAQIAAQIESRWDAVKSLINATKKYAKYESEVLESVIEQRTSISSNSTVKEMEHDDTQLNHVMGRLLAVSENYPELKTSDVYERTMESINQYEENVRRARMIYNDVVTKFNRQLKMFPSNMLASVFNFTARDYFEATESKQGIPSWD